MTIKMKQTLIKPKMKKEINTEDIKKKFITFKKAEQDFLEQLGNITDEEQFIEIMTKLQEVDNHIKMIKQPTLITTQTPTQRSYIG